MCMKKKNKTNRNADAQSAAKCMLEMKKVMLAKIIQKNESMFLGLEENEVYLGSSIF